MTLRVEEVPATATYDLRLRVLSNPSPSEADAMPEVFHVGAFDGDRLVGIGTVYPERTPHRPGRRAARLRGMAVEPEVQGTGAGRAVLDYAVDRLRSEGFDVLWANARDPALGFYERLGFEVVGDGFVGAHDIPHHVVVRDL